MVPRRCLHAGLEHRAGPRAATGTRRWLFSEGSSRRTSRRSAPSTSAGTRPSRACSRTMSSCCSACARPGVPNYCITNFSSAQIRPVAGALSLPLGLRRHRRVGRRASPEARSGHLQLLLDRYGLKPGTASSSTISKANVEGARAVGMHAIHFVEPMDSPPNCGAYGSADERLLCGAARAIRPHARFRDSRFPSMRSWAT